LHGEQPYKYAGGECVVPQRPGLGLNVDEKALVRYRVEGLEARPVPQTQLPPGSSSGR
jgi:L-alanine-DL-glutamate epimerase-like enolase superfamily enzyme